MAHRSRLALALRQQWAQAEQGDDGLVSGSRVGLVLSSAMSTVNCDLQDTSTHSMKAARLSQGPSPFNCSRVAALSLAWLKEQRQ